MILLASLSGQQLAQTCHETQTRGANNSLKPSPRRGLGAASYDCIIAKAAKRPGLAQALAAMKFTRDDMLASLKATVVPHLREIGFKGSMPHFYRERTNHVDLLTFQFSQWGGQFVAEASFVDSSRQNIHPVHKQAPPQKMRVSSTGSRHRIGKDTFKRDPWLVYDQPSSKDITGTPDELSQLLVSLIDREGVTWWESKRASS